MRRRSRPLVAGLLALCVAGGCASGDEVGSEPVDRVLVVSMPGVAWDDVQEGKLPNLAALVEESAVGDMSTRLGRRQARITEAYLTIGAGTRALAPDDGGGRLLEPDELYAGLPASEVLARRLGYQPDGIGYLAIGRAVDRNAESPFGAEVGTLGDHLEQAGVRRAVVANADGVEGGDADVSFDRSAAAALIDSEGVVPGGAVSRGLLVEDATAPFGLRLDEEAVLGAFDETWGDGAPGDRAVVLVEASDLVRAAAYERQTSPPQRRALRDAALADADALLGDLLERVDPERDAVVVVSPVAPTGAPALGVVSVRAPGIPPGLLRSATTRRDGYVQLADLAPSVLGLLGEDAPEAIEGRAFVVTEAHRHRVERLADAADAARFRDDVVVAASVTFTVLLILLALAALLRHHLPPALRASVPFLALAMLGAVPATFLAVRVGPAYGGVGAYVAFLVVVGAALGAVAWAVDRQRPGLGPLVAVGLVVVAIAGDVASGASLQLNSVFGYSVAVAGRFAGLGNLAFALLGSAAVVLAALIVDRYGRRGVAPALALLGLVVLVDGLPVLGADVGGVLSMVPAFGVTAFVLAGRRVGWRECAALAAVALGTILVFAFVDLARPEQARTHLARVAQHVVDRRWAPLFDNISRRWQASFGGAQLAAWATLGAVVVAVVVYLALVGAHRQGRSTVLDRLDRPTAAAAAGLVVLGFLGLVANDSSFAVPATMLIVVTPVMVFRTTSRPTAAPAGSQH